jgi:hypothetical protein
MLSFIQPIHNNTEALFNDLWLKHFPPPSFHLTISLISSFLQPSCTSLTYFAFIPFPSFRPFPFSSYGFSPSLVQDPGYDPRKIFQNSIHCRTLSFSAFWLATYASFYIYFHVNFTWISLKEPVWCTYAHPDSRMCDLDLLLEMSYAVVCTIKRSERMIGCNNSWTTSC